MPPSQVTGMLVEKTMLPLGEWSAAQELVSADPHLDDMHRKVRRPDPTGLRRCCRFLTDGRFLSDVLMQYIIECCQAAERTSTAAQDHHKGIVPVRGKSDSVRIAPLTGDQEGQSTLSTHRHQSIMSPEGAPSILSYLFGWKHPASGDHAYPGTTPSSRVLSRTLQRGELRKLLMSILSLAVLVVGFHLRRGVRERSRQALRIFGKGLRLLVTALFGEI